MAIIFRDTFEDADESDLSAHTPTPDGGAAWTVAIAIGSPTVKIDTSQKKSGSSSCRYYNPISTASSSAKRSITPQSGTFNQYVSIRRNTGGGVSSALQHMNIYTKNTADTKFGALIIIDGLDLYYYNATSKTDSLLNIVVDTWYDIKVEINVATKTFSAWINGGAFSNQKFASNKQFYNYSTWGADTMGILYFRSFNDLNAPTWDSWFDDYQIEEAAAGHGLLLSSERNRLAGVV